MSLLSSFIFSFLLLYCLVFSFLVLSSLLFSCLVLSLSLSLSVSVLFLCLSLFLSVSVSVSLCLCFRVCMVLCVLCCVVCCVVCCVWWCVARLGTQKKPPCVDSKRPRVYRHHAHMCYHMRAWCRYTRGRFESTEGEKRRERGGGSPSVLLTMRRPIVELSRALERGSPKETLGSYPFKV